MNNLLTIIEQLHKDCHMLCQQILGKYLDLSGNVGVFCQNNEEYREFLKLKDALTKPSHNPNQKYFELIEPLKVNSRDNIPTGTYTHLYIRKPDPTPYGKHLGDIDFIMEQKMYENFKKDVIDGKFPKGVEVYNRLNWDTVQITDPKMSCVTYISTKEFAEKVRMKFD